MASASPCVSDFEDRPWHRLLQQFGRWTQYAYFIRIPLIASVIVIALPLGDWLSSGVATMTRGVLAVQSGWELFFASWLAFQLAWSAMVVSRIIVAYGQDRFESAPPTRLQIRSTIGWKSFLAWSAVAVLLIVHLIVIADYDTPFWSLLPVRILIAASATVPASLVFILADLLRLREKSISTAVDHAFVLPTSGFFSRVACHEAKKPPHFEVFTSWVARLLGCGYTDLPYDAQGHPQPRVMHSGHVLAMIVALIQLVLYLVGFFVFYPGTAFETKVPVIAFPLILLTFGLWLFSAVTFFFDRYRVPVVFLTFVVMSVSFTQRSDYHYPLLPAENQVKLHPAEIVKGWLNRHPDKKQPLLIVTAAGGGIQSSAWTTEVLTQLGDRITEQRGFYSFRDSLVLLSGVSGGSVGSMYYADAYSIGGPNSDKVRENSRSSSLRQAAWGFAYPDLLRGLFPYLASRHKDRGWALENTFRQRLTNDPTLGTWSERLAQGAMPAVILNATLVETGGRLLLTNFLSEQTEASQNFSKPATNFFSLYDGCDLPVATAARLSATFTYVSPLTRADLPCSPGGIARPTYHVADGGYFDNDGIVSALEFLHQAGYDVGTLDKGIDGHPIVWIQIRAFPDPGTDTRMPADVEAQSAAGSWGTFDQIAGPLTTIMHVRTAGQRARNDFDIDEVETIGKDKFLYVPIYFAGDNAPLSWHLTHAQQEQIDLQWRGQRLGRWARSTSDDNTVQARRNRNADRINLARWQILKAFRRPNQAQAAE